MLLLMAIGASSLSASNGQAKPATLTVGDVFPRLEGEFLTGRKAVLPDAAAGKLALLLMGFTYDSRFPVEQWAEAFRGEFGERPDITFFEVPVIGGMARMGRWFIDSGMRRGTPKALHENVITVYGGAGTWKKTVGFQEASKNDAYLVLLDKDGRVRWLYHGVFSDQALAELRGLLPR
jgi:hypothetical protein